MDISELVAVRTIPEILMERAARSPDDRALVNASGGVLSYRDLLAEVTELSAQIRGAVETSGRPRIGIVMPNGADIAVAMLAAAAIGVAIPFNPRLTVFEYVQQIGALRVDAVIIPAEGMDAVVEAVRPTSVPLLTLDADRRIRSQSRHIAAEQQEAFPDDVAVVLQTSGSTGEPKLVPLSHRNLCRSAMDVATSVDLSPDDICLAMWEQFHIGGVTDLLLAPLVSGGCVVAAGSFDARRCLGLLESAAPTWFQAVPTTLQELILVARRDGLDGSRHHLRFLRSVAAALSPELQREVEAHFGVPVVRTLGMSEAAPLITSTRLPPEPDKPGSVGRSAGPEVAILSDDGETVSSGTIGQVAVRGENVFVGYEGDASATAQSFLGDWFLTGDVGFLDADAHLFLTGRLKDLINRGGEKISPSEVDTALLAHPSVKEAATFAIEHARLGEDIAAAVVTMQPTTDADLRSFLSTRLAPHKIPGSIVFLDQLPRTPVGKVDRPAIAARFRSSVANSHETTDRRSDLERLVTKVWIAELSLEDLSPEQDFVLVDGDSLAAARILFALERELDCKLPDEVMDYFTTVREMSEFLKQQGFEVRGATDRRGGKTALGAGASAYSEGHVFSGSYDEACAMVRETSTLNDLRLVLDHLVSHLAPHEVPALLTVLREVNAGSLGHTGGAGIIERMRMRAHLKAWLTDAAQYSSQDLSLAFWDRKVVTPGAILFSDPEVAASEKTLIVGFSGNRKRLLMPAYRILSALQPERVDLLLLMDHRNQNYLDGIEGIGDTFSDVTQFIDQFGAERGYKELVGMGTSGGSLAAVAAGCRVPFSKTVSVAPMPAAKHPRWMELLGSLCKSGTFDQTQIRLVYGEKSNDREAALQLQELFETAKLQEYPRARKNVLVAAEARGELSSQISKWLLA